MKKQIVVSLLFWTILISSVVYNPSSSLAVAPTPSQFVEATKVIKGIGERIGVNWSTEALSATMGYLMAQYDRSLNERNPDIKTDIDMIGAIPVMSREVNVDNPDLSDYVLTPDDFKSGVNLINSAKKELVPNNPLMLDWGKCGGVINMVQQPHSSGFPTVTWKNGTYTSGGVNYAKHIKAYWVNSYTWTGSNYTWVYTIVFEDGSMIANKSGGPFHSESYGKLANMGNCSSTITESQRLDYTSVNPMVVDNAPIADYNTFNTYNITINNIGDGLTGESVNTPLTEQEIGQIFDPNAPEPEAPEPEEKPVASSWWEWLFAPLKAIGDFITGLADFLLGLLVPSGDAVTSVFNGITDSFKAKIPIADQLGTFFGEIEEIQATETPTAPTFDVTMPIEWGGGTFPMIDFSYFDQWRNWVLNFIRFTAWFIFLKRLYARIPRMIY